MTAPSPTADMGARTFFDVAAEIDAAERTIKFAILNAARAGDNSFIVHVVERWIAGPVNDALRAASIQIDSQSPPNPLEACPPPEVTQSSSSQPEDGRL